MKPSVFAKLRGLLVLLVALASVPCFANQTFFNAAQQPDHFVLMRHALAPGTGDPSNFTLGKCETQRNLSEGGREQALALGKKFRSAGISDAVVFSSQWCRCMDTAALLNLGEATPLPLLNSFFQNPSTGPSQLRELTEFLEEYQWQAPTILVSHQVVITGLVGGFPASGEALVVRKITPAADSAAWEVVARLRP